MLCVCVCRDLILCPEVAKVEDIQVPGQDGPIRARVYDPQPNATSPLPGLVFIHGGAPITAYSPSVAKVTSAAECSFASCVKLRLAVLIEVAASSVNALAIAVCVVWLLDLQ